MKLTLSSMQMQSEECGPFCDLDTEEQHPNASPFKGVLLMVDEPSTRPPNGAEGHRIYVPKKVAKSRLGSLIRMGLNYASGLDRHNPTQKVGVIERAWIKGKEVWCSGVIWAKDFPNAVSRLRTGGMGMSMELADVLVEDKDSDVWKLIDFDFTGATALKKHAAAYERTTLAASACEKTTKGEVAAMSVKKPSKSSGNGDLAKLIANAVTTGVREGVTLAMKPLSASLEEVNASLQTQNETIGALAAATLNAAKDSDDAAAAAKSSDDADAAKDSDDASAAAKSSDDAAAAAKGKDDGTSSSSTTSEEDDDEDELKAELAGLAKLGKSTRNSLATDESGDPDPEFGRLNDNVKEGVLHYPKGHKTTVSASAQRNSGRLFQLAASAIRTAEKTRKGQQKVVKALRSEKERRRELEETVEDMQAQADEFASSIHRKTLPGNYYMLLEKSGYTVGDISASGQKLTIEQQDSIVRTARESGVQMSILDAMTFKTKLVEAGLAE